MATCVTKYISSKNSDLTALKPLFSARIRFWKNARFLALFLVVTNWALMAHAVVAQVETGKLLKPLFFCRNLGLEVLGSIGPFWACPKLFLAFLEGVVRLGFSSFGCCCCFSSCYCYSVVFGFGVLL